MKTKTDWDNFSKEHEIQEMAKHLVRHWDGLSPSQMKTLVTIGFSSGWANTGDYFERYTVQSEYTSPTRLASQRRAKLKELGFDVGAILDDSVSNIFYSLESLTDYVETPVSFSKVYPALKKNVLAAVGMNATRAKPKGWTTQTDTPEADRESLTKAYEDFDGVAVNNAASAHFVEATRYGFVRFMTAEKGLTKLESLLASIYGHAQLVRIQYNNEMLGRALSAIDINQESTKLGEKVIVPSSQPLRNLVERAALLDPEVATGLALITWEEPKPDLDVASESLSI